MTTGRLIRLLGLTAIAITATACASSSNVFERHDRYMATVESPTVDEDRAYCPVVIANGTDRQLEASFGRGHDTALLGMIPAGRSLSFRVRCDAGSIEAYGVSAFGGLLSGGYEYRTVGRVNRAGDTRLSFKLTDRVK